MGVEVRVPVVDKFGNELTVEAEAGRSMASVLEELEIPTYAALVWVDGEIGIPEKVDVSAERDLRIQVIRNYDLFNKVHDMEVDRQTVDDPVYQRRYVDIESGMCVERVVEMDEREFREYVERKFAQNVTQHSMVENGDRVALGFSGGTDSTSLLCLFQETKDKLPDFELHPVTIDEVTDGADVDLHYTKEVCEKYGISDRHHVVPHEVTEDVFGMTEHFKRVLRDLADSPDGKQALYVGHHVIRRMVEHEAERHDVGTLTLGLELAEFVSSLLGTYTTGHPLAGLGRRIVGPMNYIYPLYNISKKEIEIYHQLVLRDIVGERELESYSTLNQLAPSDRAMYLHLADVLLDTWPGIETHLYYGYEKLQDRMESEPGTFQCDNCGGYSYYSEDRREETTCQSCRLLAKQGLIAT